MLLLRLALTFVAVITVLAKPLSGGQAGALPPKSRSALSSGSAAVADDQVIPASPAPDPAPELREKLGPVGLALIPPAASLERKRWLAEWQKRVTITVRARRRQPLIDLDELLGLEPLVTRRPAPCRVILTVENRSWYQMAFRGARTSRAPETVLTEGLGTIDAWQAGVAYARFRFPGPRASGTAAGLPPLLCEGFVLPLTVTWTGMPEIKSAKRRKQARTLALQLVLRLDLKESLIGKGRFNSEAVLELPPQPGDASGGDVRGSARAPLSNERRSTAQGSPKPLRRPL